MSINWFPIFPGLHYPTDSLTTESNVIALKLSSTISPNEEQYADSDMLAQSLGQLSMEEREALYLWAVEGYTAKEIAKIGSLSRNTVLSRIHRARAKLRSLLQEVKTEVAP